MSCNRLCIAALPAIFTLLLLAIGCGGEQIGHGGYRESFAVSDFPV